MADVELLESEDATLAAGGELAAALRAAQLDHAVIYLHGDLGAGKTTFARGFLRGCGYTGRVPSPTYTLVEPYEFDQHTVYHVDLYRLADPSEVDDLGLADLDGAGVVMLIEWPERAAGRLPQADFEVTLQLEGTGRALRLEAPTVAGKRLLVHKNG